MKVGWIYKDGGVIELPSLTAVIQKEEGWYVSTCPELGVASQGTTAKEAHAMLAEAVELWIAAASAREIKRRLKSGGTVQPLQLVHAYALANVGPCAPLGLVAVGVRHLPVPRSAEPRVRFIPLRLDDAPIEGFRCNSPASIASGS